MLLFVAREQHVSGRGSNGVCYTPHINYLFEVFSGPRSIKFSLYAIAFHAICLKYILILSVLFLSLSFFHSLLLMSGTPAYQKSGIETELRDI